MDRCQLPIANITLLIDWRYSIDTEITLGSSNSWIHPSPSSRICRAVENPALGGEVEGGVVEGATAGETQDDGETGLSRSLQ
jgi:hypothetical protein